MNISVARRWEWAARAAGVAAAAASVGTAVAACRAAVGTWRAAPSVGVGVGLTVAMLPFVLGCVGAIGWLAWRLWFRWDATTARVAVGTTIGVGLLWSSLDGVPRVERWVGRADRSGIASSAAVLADLVVGAILYRRTAWSLIRSAGLTEPPDVRGQPPGTPAGPGRSASPSAGPCG